MITRPGMHRALAKAEVRKYSEPVPDELVKALQDAGLIADDHDHYLIVYRAGAKVGAVWGPATDGDWFANWTGAIEAERVADRDAALCLVIAKLEGAS